LIYGSPFSIASLLPKEKTNRPLIRSGQEAADYFDIAESLPVKGNSSLYNIKLVAVQVLITHTLKAGHFNDLLSLRPQIAGYYDEFIKMARGLDEPSQASSSKSFLAAMQEAQPFAGTGEMLPEDLVTKTLSSVRYKLDRVKADAAVQYLLDTKPANHYELKELAEKINNGHYSEAQHFSALRRDLQNAPYSHAHQIFSRNNEHLPHNKLWQRYGRMAAHLWANKAGSPYELERLRGAFGFAATPRQQVQAVVHAMEQSRSWGGKKQLLQCELSYLGDGEKSFYRDAGARYLAGHADHIGQLDDLKKNFGHQASTSEVLQVAERTCQRWSLLEKQPVVLGPFRRNTVRSGF
jgi:hypothetical protein